MGYKKWHYSPPQEVGKIREDVDKKHCDRDMPKDCTVACGGSVGGFLTQTGEGEWGTAEKFVYCTFFPGLPFFLVLGGQFKQSSDTVALLFSQLHA